MRKYFKHLYMGYALTLFTLAELQDSNCKVACHFTKHKSGLFVESTGICWCADPLDEEKIVYTIPKKITPVSQR